MKLIKINNNNVELAEGALLVPEFEKIYKDNKNYIDYFKVIFLYADPSSAYTNYPEEARKAKLSNDFKVKFTEDLLTAIEKYKEMSYSFNMRYYEANKNALNKTMDYLNNIDYSQIDVKGNLIYNIKTVTDTVKNCASILASLTALEEKVNAEQLTNNKTRGNANIRKREE